MKRFLLSITLFIGLIPNLNEMTVSSIYCAIGQSLFEELDQGGESHLPHCDLCDARMTEGFFNSERIVYCPDCDILCTNCGVIYRKGHEGTHTCPENSEDNNSNGTTRYKCLTCNTIYIDPNSIKSHIANSRGRCWDYIIIQ